MRTSLDFEEKKAFEGIPSPPQDHASSTQEHDKDVRDLVAHDEESPETRSIAESQLPPPPDGGLQAWLKVLGSFLIYINIWYVVSQICVLWIHH